MYSPHFFISSSLLTIDHKISTNRAELLVFFAISFREQKQSTVCLTKVVITCTSTYFRLLELERGTLDQSRNLSFSYSSMTLWQYRTDNSIEIRILELEISDSRKTRKTRKTSRGVTAVTPVFNI